MKSILLDNCVDHRFARLLPDHKVIHCREKGWETLQNGALQRAAAAEFDVLLTVDRKMSFQTSLTGLDLCVIVVRVNRNRLDHLQVMLPAIEAEILKSVPGSFVTIEP